METSQSMQDKELEEIKKDKKVQRAMSETSISVQEEKAVELSNEPPQLGITIIIFLICGVLYFLLGWKNLPISSIYIPLLQRVVIAVMLISFV
jgi:hypothetical protein